LLLATDEKALYRRSSDANYAVWDINSKTLVPLYKAARQRYATFNPQGDKVAWVSDNNLFVKNLANNEVFQITTDGAFNKIINGATDWVYEEEFVLVQGFEWSPDGKKIAFVRFDESAVPEYGMDIFNDKAYPERQTFKYPKVGERNALVSVHVFDTETQAQRKLIGGEEDIYYPRFQWTTQNNQLCVTRLNRLQNNLELVLINTNDATNRTLLTEKNKYYISINDDLNFLDDGQHFTWTSEQNGFNHIYMYDMNGRPIAQITKGDFDVTRMYGIDEKNGLIYYQAAAPTPMDKQLFSVRTDGSDVKCLTPSRGVHDAQWSSTFDYYVHTASTLNAPATVVVKARDGRAVRSLEDNQKVRALQVEYGAVSSDFFNFKTSEGISLNGWLMKPAKMKKRKKYPVLMFVYGGPGSQQVLDQWKGANYWWFQLLTQKGFIVACVDGRGTGGRGEEFKKMTYKQLGHYETKDQIEAAKYLGTLKNVDAARIGIFGWSYGGYMSSLCAFKGADVFKAAIAVAPVTNWKWYDTVYTERYMQTEKENLEGYRDNSPVYFANLLRGDNFLLVHGIADDNVHVQNTTELSNALINANKQYDTYLYPNRNHGISGGNARLHLYTKMTNFLLEKL
jgi:dipeptidyl-peptidase-4